MPSVTMQMHSTVLAGLLTLVITGCSSNSGPPVTIEVPVTAGPATLTTPTVQLSFSPQTLAAGDSATLTWESKDATACSGSGVWSGSQALVNQSGFNTGALTDGTYSYGLTCTGPGGSGSKVVTLVVGQVAAPVVQLQASPVVVRPGNSVSLTWSTSNATSCTGMGGTGSDGWAASQAVANSAGVSEGPFTAEGEISYELDCTGPGGTGSASQIVTVSAAAPAAPPVVTLNGPSGYIQPGGSFSLNWNTTGATACTAGGGSGSDSWNGTQATSSSGMTIGPIANVGTYTYTLTCVGPGGSAGGNFTLVVANGSQAAGPAISINIASPTISAGTSTWLSWTTNNVTSCTASGSWSGPQPLSGSSVSTGTLLTAGAYSYTLTCSGAGGTATQTAALQVSNPVATVDSFSIAPNSITAGQTAALSWSTSNATTCIGSGGTGGWGASQATASTGTSVGPINSPGVYVFTLTCSGPGGTGSAGTATLLVNAPPPAAVINTFSATPNSIQVGATTSLAWSSSNATACTASASDVSLGFTGSRPVTNGGLTVGPFTSAGTYTFTLNCTGNGAASGPTTVAVAVGAATPPASITNLTATPGAIQAGQTFSLSWASSGASACSATGGSGNDAWLGSELTANAGLTIGPLLIPGTYAYILTCSGTGGSSGPAAATVTVNAVTPPAAIGNFTATPNSIQAGGTIQLAWTTTNASSCTASAGSGSDSWTGSQPVSSSGVTVGPLSAAGNYTYTLTCTGPGGSSGPISTAVAVGSSTPPASILSFSATPNTIETGHSTSLAWSSSNATSCTATGGTGADSWTGTLPASSSGQSVGPVVAIGTVTYTLSCTGPGGASGTSSVSVTVGVATPPPSITGLAASPTTLQAGQSTSLSWGTTNATACTASGGAGGDNWSGVEPTSTTGITIGPLTVPGTYTYTLACVGTGGTSGPSSVSITVTPTPVGPPVVVLQANNAATTQIQPGTSFTLKWSATNATACTAVGGTGSDTWSGSQSTSSAGTTIGPIGTPGMYVYTLSCTGTGGSSSASVTVTVITATAADCGVGFPTLAWLAPTASVTSQLNGVCLLGGCGVANSSRVIDANPTNFSAMTLAVGVAATDTLTVTSGTGSYPAGRKVGFLISQPGHLLSLSLLGGVAVQTLAAGVVQETAIDTHLLQVSALGLLADPNEGFANFTTSKPFDAVRIQMGSLVSVGRELDVYGACVSLQ